MAKPLKVIRKNRLRALALPFVNNSGLRPELASGDYLMFPIHDGSGHAIRVSKDSFFGHSEERSKYPQWWSLSFAITFPDPDPEAPFNSKIHYMFKAVPPCQLGFKPMKRFANRILEVIYEKVGAGEGTAFASIMPPNMVEEHLRQGLIVKYTENDLDDNWFQDWSVSFLDDLHYVDPATIPTWENPQKQKKF